jgi:ribulose bisphosphate carboxylase small subunit
MAYGDIFHTIRFSNGSWQDWRNVSATVANNPGQISYLACAGIGNDLHLIGATPPGNLFHTIRYSNGSWQNWDPVSSRAANNPGQISELACAGIGNDLHLIGATPTGDLFHTIRYSNGSWQNWRNVSAANNPVQPGDMLFESCAGIGNDLHVTMVVRPQIP